MAQTPLLDNSPERKLAELEGRLARLEGSAASGLPNAAVGTYRLSLDKPASLSGLVFNAGVEMLCNGSTFSTATYSRLNALIVAAGGTAGTLPDLVGRLLMSVGSSSTTVFGQTDGSTVANRSAHHNTSNNLGLSGLSTSSVSAGTPTGSISTVVTGVTFAGAGDSSDGSGGSPKVIQAGTFATIGAPTFTGSALASHSHTVSGSLSGSVGPGGAFPTDTPAFGAYLWVWLRCS